MERWIEIMAWAGAAVFGSLAIRTLFRTWRTQRRFKAMLRMVQEMGRSYRAGKETGFIAVPLATAQGHTCTVCFVPMDRHPQPDGALDGVWFLHPPCCLGCECGSYEAALAWERAV